MLENVDGMLSHCRHGQVVAVGSNFHRIDGLVHHRDSIFCAHFVVYLSSMNVIFDVFVVVLLFLELSIEIPSLDQSCKQLDKDR